MRKIFSILFLLLFVTSFGQGKFTFYVGKPAGLYGPDQSGNITFADSDFWASLPGYDKGGYTGRSTAGYVEFITEEVDISVKVAGDWVGQGAESKCEVVVNGVWNQSVTVTSSGVIQTIPITLPAGQKTVRLINGYTANGATVNRPLNGVFVQGVVTDSVFNIVLPKIPESKWLFVGNSITTGASSSHPAVTGFVGLFRDDGIYVQADSWGARYLDTDNDSKTSDMAHQLVDQMTGTTRNYLFMMLGTNNFFFGYSKAYFKDELQRIFDSVHTINPTITIWYVSPLNRTSYSTPNVNGATPDDYYYAAKELQATRSWLKVIYGKTMLTLSNAPDGLHPNDAGMIEVHDNLTDSILFYGGIIGFNKVMPTENQERNNAIAINRTVFIKPKTAA